MKGERRVELMDGTGAVGVRYGRGSDGMAPTLSYLKITISGYISDVNSDH